MSHCICLVVLDDIWQFSFCLVVFDGIWRKFFASFLALKRVNELIFTTKVWNSLRVCYTWDCSCITFCVPVFYRFSSLLVKRFNQVYPLTSVLFSKHIIQVKITTSNQIQGNFDINVNSEYWLIQKIVFKLLTLDFLLFLCFEILGPTYDKLCISNLNLRKGNFNCLLQKCMATPLSLTVRKTSWK